MLKENEFKGFWSCMKRTVKEEGARGLFRGYSAYMLAISLWMSVLPHATEFLMH